MLKKALFFIVAILSCASYAQSITIQGKVTDTLQNPLTYANIIASPEADTSIQFAITDNAGDYNLKLKKNQTYQITVSYLGYIAQTYTITALQNHTKNLVLHPSSESLDEVTISYAPPVIVKKDTTIYSVDAFTTGKERKLRDVLKKLPAIEVDREGNVTAQGKKITKVLVDEKVFFTGNSKLAVNNIPANVIDKIEILDNYNEVAFLKGLEDSDEMVMNIKLKEDKKNFIFGDIEIGAGVKDRYLANPSLYYYSPKTSINAIGDFNNTGIKSFTLQDYLEFEGGLNKLFNDAKSYFSILNSDFSQFLANTDFTSSTNYFGALSLNQKINTTTNLSSYGIWSGIQNTTKLETENKYNTLAGLIENRSNTGSQNNHFGIGKLSLKLTPSSKEYVAFSSYVKVSENDSERTTLTATPENSNSINSKKTIKNNSFKQALEWYKKFSSKQTISTLLNYHYQKGAPKTNWLTDQAVFQELLPIIESDSYDVFKTKELKSHAISALIKKYWVLNRSNHIYLSLGTQLNFENLKTDEYQVLDDMSINNFSSAGFGNDTKLHFNDTYIGLQYKTQIGRLMLKPGLFYHNYYWSITQNPISDKNQKTLLLPEFIGKFEFANYKKLNFRYHLKAVFPSIKQLSNQFTLLDFNNIYQGDNQLKNELYHSAQVNYSNFLLVKNLFYNLTANYRLKERSFKNITTIEGINFISVPILLNNQDRRWHFSGGLKKGYSRYKFSVKGSVVLADYESPINDELISSTSSNYTLDTGLEIRFKKLPEIELNYKKSFSEYKSISISRFETSVFAAFLEYAFLKDFIIKADYSFEEYKNKTTGSTNVFNIANTSLYYQKEGSPWGVELGITNIFDLAFKQRNSFSEVLISDEKTYVLPRIVLLKILYKL